MVHWFGLVILQLVLMDSRYFNNLQIHNDGVYYRYLGHVSKFEFNFGNGFFGTTAITSAGSNGNGSLFEYDVPSGYYALNTKNINTYG